MPPNISFISNLDYVFTFFIKVVYSSLEVKLKYSDNKGILKSHALIENVPKYPIFRTRSNDFLRQLQSKI
jgi:hypothetical protein